MVSGRSEIHGFKEARETLQEFSRTVQRNVGRRALMAPALVIAAAVRAKAPVSNDPGNPTPGSLRDSVKVAAEKARKSGPRIAVVAEDVAAVPNEFGTSKMAAQPFFRPAVDGARAAAGAAFAAALKPEIDAAAKRAAKRAK